MRVYTMYYTCVLYFCVYIDIQTYRETKFSKSDNQDGLDYDGVHTMGLVITF